MATWCMPVVFCNTISPRKFQNELTKHQFSSVRQSVSIIQLKEYSRQPVCSRSGYLSVYGIPWVRGINRTLPTLYTTLVMYDQSLISNIYIPPVFTSLTTGDINHRHPCTALCTYNKNCRARSLVQALVHEGRWLSLRNNLTLQWRYTQSISNAMTSFSRDTVDIRGVNWYLTLVPSPSASIFD